MCDYSAWYLPCSFWPHICVRKINLLFSKGLNNLAKWSGGGEITWSEEVSTESGGVSEEVSGGLGEEWRLVIDNAVDTLWQKAPTGNLTVAWQLRQQSPPKKDSNVDRLIQFVAGQLFFDPHNLDALPIWYLPTILRCPT